MNRVTAGEAFSLTYDVGSSGETYTAEITDAVGRVMDSTVSESAPNVTVSVGGILLDVPNLGAAGGGGE